MPERNWYALLSNGLALVDRTQRLLSRSTARARSGGEAPAAPPQRRIDPERALKVAHRVLDAFEEKPRRGLFG